MAIIGRAPKKFTLPPDHETWVELRKLSGPEKADYQAALAGSTVQSMRYLWDRAVVGFRLNSEQGIVNWPDEKHPEVFDGVFAGLEDHEYVYIQAAAFVQNEILNHNLTRAYEALLKVGSDALPDSILGALQDWQVLTPAQQQQAIADIDGILGPDPGDTLGNSGGSSGTSGPGMTATNPGEAQSETGTQEPES